MPSATWRPPRRFHAGHRAHARNRQALQDVARGSAVASPTLRGPGKDPRPRRVVQGSPRPRSSSARRARVPGPNQAQAGRSRRSAPAGQPGARHREEPAGRSILLQARALAETGSTPAEKDQQQRRRSPGSRAVTKANPRFEDAFHTLAELHLKRKIARPPSPS